MSTKSEPALAAVTERLRAAGCVFAEAEARILAETATTSDDLDRMIQRRAAGLPLEYVVGWADFCGRRIAVDEGVFVPRARTELLVGEAARLLRQRETVPVVVDLCCGSGALGAAVAVMCGAVELHASDIDPIAVRCAQRNVAPHGGRAYQGDLYQPLPAELRARVDIIVANVPYVPTADIAFLPPEARDHEPRKALDGGDDGLHVARRVIADARRWLAPGGHLLFEVGDRQIDSATEAVCGAGLLARVVTADDDDAPGAVIVGSLATP